MSSLTIPPHHFLLPPRLVGHLNFQTIYLPLTVVINPRSYRRQQGPHQSVCFDFERSFLGFGNSKNRHYYEGCCCSKGWESEEDFILETEILEFMKKSEKPEVFPTKEELVDAGRMDLVEGIVKKGGWLSMGWDLRDENKEEEVQVIDIIDRDCDDSYGVSSVSSYSSHTPSSSGRSFGMKDEQETGIEGILTRLEKQRNLSFVTGLGENGYSARAVSKDGISESHIETSNYWDSADLVSSSRLASDSHNNGITNNSGSKLSHSRSVTDFGGSMSSVTSETWQSWSIRRAGFSNSEFEAAEISLINNEMDEGKGASDAESLNKQKDTSNNDIRTRLHHLEVELSSALGVLRSKSVEYVPKEVRESSDDLRELSDALEFQENEIMKAKDRLRSIRAKLAVLEGKMTLAIIDAQKIIEVKQKRIDGGSRALHLLRTTCIVWPNSASEVLLAGSFDGWTTQRKMEKSSAGIFSLCLKLYPGRYEIKFIVDGIWKTDPLRPIVYNNGYENNLLIIN